jgi:hypothetical protein
MNGDIRRLDITRLKQYIARIRRDIRQAFELQRLIDADLDCTACAQRLMRVQADLMLFAEKRDHLGPPERDIRGIEVGAASIPARR